MYPHEILEPIVLLLRSGRIDVQRIDAEISTRTRFRWQDLELAELAEFDPLISNVLKLLELANLELWWEEQRIKDSAAFQWILMSEVAAIKPTSPEFGYLKRMATSDGESKLHTVCRVAVVCRKQLSLRRSSKQL